MRHRNVVTVNRIGGAAPHGIGRQVSDYLMAIEVEIDPMIGASPLRTAEKIAVESTRSGQIVDGKGEMERRQCHRGPIVIADVPKQ